MHDDYERWDLHWIYRTWADAYDAAKKLGWDGLWFIRVYDLDSDATATSYYVAERKHGARFKYRPEYSRDVDPSEEDDNVVWGHA
jgi:hypothetical protein